MGLTVMPEAAEDLLDNLAEEFLTRYRRGERPSLDEYTSKHAELGSQIRELFPALVELEELGSVLGPSARPTSAAPSVLGEFRIVREIGRGGMGVVFEAVQETLGRRVALKLLPTGPGTPPQLYDRFRREAQIAAKLHHGHIVPVFGVGNNSGFIYYAMQYIDGQGIDQVLKHVRARRQGSTIKLQDTEAPGAASDVSKFLCEGSANYYRHVAKLGERVADALSYSHDQGVLHRDVKPSNLLLEAGGHIWVTDFGLARAEDANDLTRTGDVLGTPRFMAPERFRGEADARSDVYSLGVTLFEMLTLEPAFAESDRVKLTDMIMRGRFLPPRHIDPHLPRDLETIVVKAMATEPVGRYASCALMAEDLRRFAAGEPIAARPPKLPERVAKWSRRNPAWAAAIAVAFLALATVAGVVGAYSLRLRDALSDANKNLLEAQTQNRRADENLAELRKAVDQFAKLVMMDPQLKQVDLTETRQKLLTSAVQAYENIIAQTGDNENVLAAKGQAHYRLGLLLDSLGRKADAEAHNAKSIEIWQQLVERSPKNGRYRLLLVGSLHNRGNMLEQLNRSMEAEALIERASKLCRDGLAMDPNDELLRASLALHCRGIGHIRTIADDYPRAAASFQEALALIDGLVRDRPNDVDYRVSNVAMRRQYGYVFQRQEKNAQAAHEYRTARDVANEALRQFPGNDDTLRELGETVVLLAQVCQYLHEYGDAEKFANEAIEIFEKQHAKYPSQPEQALGLARSLSRLSDVRFDAGQIAESLEPADRAVAVVQDNTLEKVEGRVERTTVRVAYEHRAFLMQRLRRWADAAADYSAAIRMCDEFEDWRRCAIGRCQSLDRAGQLDQAETEYRDAITIFDRKVEQYPDIVSYRRDRVLFVFQLGALLVRRDRVEPGLEMVRHAVAERDEIANRSDPSVEDLRLRILVYQDTASIMRQLRRLQDSMEWLNRALKHLDELATRSEEKDFVDDRRWRAYYDRGWTRRALHQNLEGAADYGAAAELAKSAEQASVARYQQADLLLREGEVARALKIDADYVAGQPVATDNQYALAGFVCRLAAALAQDDPRREPLLDRGVKYLKTSQRPASALIQDNPDFAILKDRADFQAIGSGG